MLWRAVTIQAVDGGDGIVQPLKRQNLWTEPDHPLWITIPKSVGLVSPRDWSSEGPCDDVDKGLHHHRATMVLR